VPAVGALWTRLKAVAAWIDALSNWIKGVAAAVTAVTGVLIFFFPGCQPEKPCQGSLGATLTSASIDQSVRFRSYLELVGASRGQASQERLNEVGKLIDFRVHASGFRHQRLEVMWWLLTSAGEPPAKRVSGQLGTIVKPDACVDNAREKIWAGPIPRDRKSYRVEIRLVDPNGTELDRIRTSRFQGLG
jgi:hypothetical protein